MKVAILGGGISGLSCGWLLQQEGIDFKIFERQSYYGGLARSFDWHGFHCDIASHRLFTNDRATLERLQALTPLIRHNRRSKIFIHDKWITDPVSPIELVLRFFPSPGLRFVRDYLLREHMNGRRDESFDTHTLSRFGKSLNSFFFQPYTEKLFGLPASQVSAEWAKQKVRVTSLLDLLRKDTKIYFNHFYYPKEGGYGAFARRLYDDIKENVLLSTTVREVHKEENFLTGITYESEEGSIFEQFDVVVSTLPATLLGHMLDFQLSLRFRSVRLLYLLVNKPKVSDNHWVYFAHEDIVTNRLGEFKNFSDYGVPKDKTVLCGEITMDYPEEQLIERAVNDFHRIGFLDKSLIADSLLVKEKFGYPIYDLEFMKQVRRAANFFGKYENLYLLGRNAEFQHKEVDDNFGAAVKLVRKLKEKKLRVHMPLPELSVAGGELKSLGD